LLVVTLLRRRNTDKKTKKKKYFSGDFSGDFYQATKAFYLGFILPSSHRVDKI